MTARGEAKEEDGRAKKQPADLVGTKRTKIWLDDRRESFGEHQADVDAQDKEPEVEFARKHTVKSAQNQRGDDETINVDGGNLHKRLALR